MQNIHHVHRLNYIIPHVFQFVIKIRQIGEIILLNKKCHLGVGKLYVIIILKNGSKKNLTYVNFKCRIIMYFY